MPSRAIWFALETGLELADITYQAHGWDAARRIVVVRQSIKRKTAPGKMLPLFADNPDILRRKSANGLFGLNKSNPQVFYFRRSLTQMLHKLRAPLLVFMIVMKTLLVGRMNNYGVSP